MPSKARFGQKSPRKNVQRGGLSCVFHGTSKQGDQNDDYCKCGHIPVKKECYHHAARVSSYIGCIPLHTLHFGHTEIRAASFWPMLLYTWYTIIRVTVNLFSSIFRLSTTFFLSSHRAHSELTSSHSSRSQSCLGGCEFSA